MCVEVADADGPAQNVDGVAYLDRNDEHLDEEVGQVDHSVAVLLQEAEQFPTVTCWLIVEEQC